MKLQYAGGIGIPLAEKNNALEGAQMEAAKMETKREQFLKAWQSGGAQWAFTAKLAESVLGIPATDLKPVPNSEGDMMTLDESLLLWGNPAKNKLMLWIEDKHGALGNGEFVQVLNPPSLGEWLQIEQERIAAKKQAVAA